MSRIRSTLLGILVSIASVVSFGAPTSAQCPLAQPQFQNAFGSAGCGSGQFGRIYAITSGPTGKLFAVDTSPATSCYRLTRYDRTAGEELSVLVPGLDQNGDADIMVLGDTAYVAIRDANTVIAFNTGTLTEIFRKPVSVSLSNPRFLGFEPRTQTIIAGCDNGRGYLLERNLSAVLDPGGMPVQVNVHNAIRGVSTRSGEIWIGCLDQVVYRYSPSRLPSGRLDLTPLSSFNLPVPPFEFHFDQVGRLFIAPSRPDAGQGDELRGYSVSSAGVFTLLTCWGAQGIATGAFDRITGFSADSAYGFAVADLENNRFQLFDWTTAAAIGSNRDGGNLHEIVAVSARSTEFRVSTRFIVDDQASIAVFDVMGRRVPSRARIEAFGEDQSLVRITPLGVPLKQGIYLVRIESRERRARGKVVLVERGD